ncbi:hypothetical protein JTB14_023476 [Gonioctena quinquepunctata]|nr:hypothetical protein JTB14_023476 [Gonioctena quinquepunctata]
MSASIEWTHEAIEKLIDLYRKKSELWDPKENTYHIKTKKHDAWTNISLDMGIDVDAVKSKITSLLSSYRREKGKTKKSTGTGKGRGGYLHLKLVCIQVFLSEKDTPKDTLNTEEVS